MKEIIELIKRWIEEKKVGNLTVNFFKGGISSIKLEETIKLNQLNSPSKNEKGE